MQKITLIGFLGRDAAVRESKNGKKFISMTVGANGVVNGVQKSSWYDVMWFNYSENIVPHLKKGSGVVVIGELDADIEVGNDGVTRCRRNVMADSITFNSTGKSQENDGNQQQTQSTSKASQPKNSPEPPTDDEISVVSHKPAPEEANLTSTDESDLPF